MEFVRIYIVLNLLILGYATAITASKLKSFGSDVNGKNGNNDEHHRTLKDFKSKDESHEGMRVIEGTKEEEEQEEEEENLPVLPPIILLDFDNGTNTGADGKSKRTVNDNIGHGFLRNSFIEGKTNYYFPAGKSGTTVTIEESISPFLPRTIVERLQPSTTTTTTPRSNYFEDQQVPVHSNNNYYPPDYNVKTPIFGQRTKLYKTYDKFYQTTPSPVTNHQDGFKESSLSSFMRPPSPHGKTRDNQNMPFSYQNYNQNPYENSDSITESNGSASNWNVRLHYRPTPSSSNEDNVNVPTHGSEQQSNSNRAASTSAFYSKTHDSQYYRNIARPNVGFSQSQQGYQNSPKYTVENGVRYENKVYWKYPDGRITDVAPPTYVESDYNSTNGGVDSQGPVKFPVNQPRYEDQTTAHPFISAESLSSSLPQQQVYRLGYQNLVGSKNTANLVQLAKTMTPGAPTRIVGGKSSQQRVPLNSRYMINNPNPEYANVHSSDAIPQRTETAPQIKTSADSGDTQQSHLPGLNNYFNLQYSDLLSYNPSISEYVRNPASILNVHPTFIQTGKSLVPVIILRVDGAPPIHSKDVPNVNLKALLQQYLVQYAKSVQELARPSDYEFGNVDYNSRSQNLLQGGNRLLDLAQLVNKNEPHSSSSSVLPQHSTPSSYMYRTDYESGKTLESDRSKFDTATRRTKVKSVEIIDDPRFTSYRVKN